jgi:hypothetical protein
MLWEQMASPVQPEREAAARELGECLLVEPDRAPDQALQWISGRRSESGCIDALLPLVWAKLRSHNAVLPDFERAAASIQYPSLLANRLLSWLYGRSAAWDIVRLFDSSVVPDQTDKQRFAIAMRSMPGFYRGVRPPRRWRVNFHQLFSREFAVVDRRLGRPSLDKVSYGQLGQSFIPNFETQIFEAVVSGFHRACAAATVEHGDVPEYDWAGAPIAPAFWLAPSAAPNPELVPLLLADSIQGVIEALEGLRGGDLWPARIHARTHHSKNLVTDLEIATFYQRVEGDGIPSTHDVLALFSQPQLQLPGIDDPVTFDAQEVSDWRRVVGGWEVLPATLALSSKTVALWQADLCLRAPAIPFSTESLRAQAEECRTVGVFRQGGNEIGNLRFWIARPDLLRTGDVLAPIGIATVLNRDFVNRMADLFTAVPALVIRRTTYSREHDYGEVERSTNETFLGTTSIFIPQRFFNELR